MLGMLVGLLALYGHELCTLRGKDALAAGCVSES